jgi:hypothetical protein
MASFFNESALSLRIIVAKVRFSVGKSKKINFGQGKKLRRKTQKGWRDNRGSNWLKGNEFDEWVVRVRTGRKLHVSTFHRRRRD